MIYFGTITLKEKIYFNQRWGGIFEGQACANYLKSIVQDVRDMKIIEQVNLKYFINDPTYYIIH